MDFDYKYFNDIDIGMIESTLNKHNLSGRLYSTNAGYHLFITSNKVHHRDCKTIGMLFDQNDYRYLSFAMKFGYKVRLNRKIGDTKEVNYIGKLGTVTEDPYLLNLINIHDMYIEKHR